MLILLLYLWDSITSTTNPPATSRKRVNDESAPEEPPAKRTKKSNPRGGVVKKGVEVETRFEVRSVAPGAHRSGRLAKLSFAISLSSQAQVNLVQVDLYGSSLTGLVIIDRPIDLHLKLENSSITEITCGLRSLLDSGGPGRIMPMLTWRKLTWHTHTLKQVGLLLVSLKATLLQFKLWCIHSKSVTWNSAGWIQYQFATSGQM
jgi:hypothetical protein